MKLLLLVSLAGWVLSCSALVDPVTRISRQHVETFWESWDMTHSNYGSNLSALPVVPIGSVGGFNVVNLAFADADATSFDITKCYLNPDCVTPGLYFMHDNENHDAFHRSIQKNTSLPIDPGMLTLWRTNSCHKRPSVSTNIFKAIHDAGGFVKIAYGGTNAYNPGDRLNQEELESLVVRIKNLVNDFNLDGVEFTFNVYCAGCDHPENPIYLINSLRHLMPNKIISMTYPGTLMDSYLNEVTMATFENIDYIMVEFISDNYLEKLDKMGIPRNKIVWGYIQGRYPDNVHEPCDTHDLVEGVERVKSEQLGGVMTWSINSDTYYRKDQIPDVPAGKCSLYQTGQEDGTFIRTASYHLNQL